MSKYILVEKQNSVASAILNNNEKQNSLTPDFIDEIKDSIHVLESDKAISIKY